MTMFDTVALWIGRSIMVMGGLIFTGELACKTIDLILKYSNCMGLFLQWVLERRGGSE